MYIFLIFFEVKHVCKSYLFLFIMNNQLKSIHKITNFEKRTSLKTFYVFYMKIQFCLEFHYVKCFLN